jgi:anti-sigma regulatory factor (Ser/Thr protein kinase)
MEVEDEGAGFDLARCLVVPREGDVIEREDGRGLFLMHSLMDRVEVFATEANVVRLTLHRT